MPNEIETIREYLNANEWDGHDLTIYSAGKDEYGITLRGDDVTVRLLTPAMFGTLTQLGDFDIRNNYSMVDNFTKKRETTWVVAFN